MLCLTWLLVWEGRELGAMGAGATGRVRVSLAAAGPEEGGGTATGQGPWLGGGGGGGGAAGCCCCCCFLGMTNEPLASLRGGTRRGLEDEGPGAVGAGVAVGLLRLAGLC